jgi:hypothetical protein
MRLVARNEVRQPTTHQILPAPYQEPVVSFTNRARLNVESLDLRIVPAVVDLSTAGSGAVLGNGAIVHRNDAAWNNANGPQAHGRGTMDSFLRIDANGVEEGFNTTARPFQLDQVKNGTTALTLSQVPVVTVNGTAYREFVLDVNEPGNKGRTLSLDEVRVYVADQGNLKNYNGSNGKLGGQSPVYNLDSAGNVTVMLKSMVNQGPRASEMALLVPNSLFAGKSNGSFVYVYSKFGGSAPAGGDAEEWGVRHNPPSSPSSPPPATGSVSGQVFADGNQDGTLNTDAVQVGSTLFVPDAPLEGVTVQLLSGSTVVATTTTDADGNYKFSNVAAGTYSVREVQPADYADGADYHGGVAVGTAGSTDQIDGVAVLANADSGGNVFTESGGTVSGVVVFDANQDRNLDDGVDHGIGGAVVTLTVLTDPNNPQVFTTTTDANGAFTFSGLAAGTYTLTEDPDVSDPNSGQHYWDGADFHGAFGDPNMVDSSAPNEFDNIALTAGQQDQNYTFTHWFGFGD